MARPVLTGRAGCSLDRIARKQQTVVGKRAVVLVSVGLLVVVVGLLSYVRADRLIQFAILNGLYDNVPSFASCSQSPPVAEIDRALRSHNPFRVDGGVYSIEAMPLDDCPDRAHLEIQYAGRETRLKLEQVIAAEGGDFKISTGWWWRSIPVSLRNV